VVIDHPPVNALDVAGWFALADALIAAGRVPDNRVVILRAEGRGFCAGVDIKEINAKGDEALVGVNRGCAAAFAAVYDCEVPVIAAVQGFCLGGGIGLIGNADIVVASEDATFGLPEVDRGALGAATHLARLVPQHAMRKMVYTAKAISAAELASYGSVAAVVPLANCARPRWPWPARSPPKAPRSSGGPRSRSTASIPSTSSAATASSRDSPTSSTCAGWPTSSGPPSSRSARRTEVCQRSDRVERHGDMREDERP
jgi:enoyl-CoA hydratase/carnithine racemase